MQVSTMLTKGTLSSACFKYYAFPKLIYIILLLDKAVLPTSCTRKKEYIFLLLEKGYLIQDIITINKIANEPGGKIFFWL